MPIYRYKCAECAYEVELIQKMSEKRAPANCATCGATSMMTVLSTPMFVLKGRGWARDGYHYAKTPADTLPGYSDQDRQTLLPSKKTAPVVEQQPQASVANVDSPDSAE